MTTKDCIKCGENKPLDQYNDSVNLNKRGDCKTCESIYTAAYYQRNKARIKENEALRRQRAKLERTRKLK